MNTTISDIITDVFPQRLKKSVFSEKHSQCATLGTGMKQPLSCFLEAFFFRSRPKLRIYSDKVTYRGLYQDRGKII